MEKYHIEIKHKNNQVKKTETTNLYYLTFAISIETSRNKELFM